MSKIRSIQKQRRYSVEFKKSLVQDFESGRFSVTQMGRLHQICPQVIYSWIYKFSTFNDKSYRIVEMKESSTDKLKKQEERIRELEQLLGQKQVTIEFLEKMIELASVELNYDIKKKCDTPPLAGSTKIKNK